MYTDMVSESELPEAKGKAVYWVARAKFEEVRRPPPSPPFLQQLMLCLCCCCPTPSLWCLFPCVWMFVCLAGRSTAWSSRPYPCFVRSS